MRINEPGNFFPLTICSGYLDLTEETRANYVKEIETQKLQNPKKDDLDKDSTWTGDVNNNSAIHTNPIFNEFFGQLKPILESYCEEIGFNHSKFNFYIARAWGTASTQAQEISPHDHGYANITIVYYPQVSPKAGRLLLQPFWHHNEIVQSLFNDESYEHNILDSNNFNCARYIGIQPDNDLFVVFPAKTPHSTKPSLDSEPRYSIAVDVVVTLKEINNTEYALPPIQQWSKL